MKTRRGQAAKAGSLLFALFALFAQFIINRKRGWWKAFLDSTGRDGRSISCLYGSRSEIFTQPSIGLWYSTITFIQDFSACRIFAIRPLLHISSMTGASLSGLS